MIETTPGRGLTVTPEMLQAIASAAGLGQVQESTWLTRGRNNPALLLNQDYVLRFDGLPGSTPQRFAGEALAYRLLREQGIPAPEVIALDLGCQLAPVAYMLMQRLPGQPVIDSWADLTPMQREQVAYQCGDLLARMHGITASHYGDLRAPEITFPTWSAYIDDYITRYLREALTDQLIDTALAHRLRATFDRWLPTLQTVPTPCLVHRDFHFENVMQQDGIVTGILDFEWALWGDPANDFRVEAQWDGECPGSAAPLYAGYTARRPLSDDHQQRVKLYQLMMWLEFLEDAADEAEERDSRLNLLRWLDTMAV